MLSLAYQLPEVKKIWGGFFFYLDKEKKEAKRWDWGGKSFGQRQY